MVEYHDLEKLLNEMHIYNNISITVSPLSVTALFRHFSAWKLFVFLLRQLLRKRCTSSKCERNYDCFLWQTVKSEMQISYYSETYIFLLM